MSLLLGPAATAGLNWGSLGLQYAIIPPGTVEVGAKDEDNNPLRRVEIPHGFDMAKTPTTNAQHGRVIQPLGDDNTVLMVESERDRQFVIVARGTKWEIDEIENSEVMSVLESLGLLRPNVVVRLGSRFVDGSRAILQSGAACFDIIPVVLKPHLMERFDDPEQPAYVTPSEASAVAALYGLRLPTGEMWEAAAGKLRNRKYRQERYLRQVAYYGHPEKATAAVGRRDPNEHGLRDVLGNIPEIMANRYEEDSEGREIRGGSFADPARFIRVTYRMGLGSQLFRSIFNGYRLVRPPTP